MKKMKYVLFLMLGMFLLPVISMAEEREDINVYIFKSSTCPHCAEAMEFFETLEQDTEYANYFTLVPYETNGNSSEIKANVELATKVANYFDFDFEGVPLIVIGDKYYEGYASSMDEEIKEAIKSSYQNESYVDVVKGIQDGTIEMPKKSNFGAYMVLAILAVFIIGIGYLIYIARKDVVEEA